MRKLFIISMLLCCLCIMAQGRNGDVRQDDSITVGALLRQVADASSYKLFAFGLDLTKKVALPVSLTGEPAAIINEALKNMQVKVTVYDGNLFVLTKKLNTAFLFEPASSVGNYTEGIMSQLGGQEIAESENLVYIIGDPHTKEIPKTAVLSGVLTDSKTGEPMPGVSIILKGTATAAVTDGDGNYSLKMPTGKQEIELTGTGVQNSRRNLMLYGDGTLNIGMFEDVVSLGEVTITAGRIDNVKNTAIGVDKIQTEKIKNIPMALGEVDILRVVQALPGVKSVGEASSGFNVRGGATDQNLILFNNNTIYNANHMFGFFSIFNPDIVKDMEIYKSSIPAQYGGRISSVLDITSKEANKEKIKGNAGIGLVTSKLNLEIPVIKERTSLLVDGRTTYSNWLLNELPASSEYRDGKAGFYDLGLTFSHTVNERNLLNVYGYFSNDHFSFSPQQIYNYRNINASVKWRRIHSDNLTSTVTAGYDHYDYANIDSVNPYNGYKLSFNINQAFAGLDFVRSEGRHKLNYGAKTTFYNIGAGNYDPAGELSAVKPQSLQHDRGLESALYLSDELDLTDRLSVQAGLRYSMFNAVGPRTYYQYSPDALQQVTSITDTLTKGAGAVFKTYHGPELRLSARYLLRPNLSVKAGFNTMRQNIHKLSNTLVMSPTDTWKLADANIRPQQGWQAAAGLYLDTEKKVWETSAEVYYKRMYDYLDYRNSARIQMNQHIETDVIPSQGYAYGVELMAKKQTGKLNGWVSYTYSRTFLRQNSKLIPYPVNEGDWYPADYDKPHEFKLVGNYKLSQRYSFSFNVDYSTGRPTTIPAGRYYNTDMNVWQIYYTDRNTYRLPDYFRMDLSYNIEPSHKLTALTHHMLSIGCYNITGRKNVYSIYYLPSNGEVQGYKLTIFAVPIPYITYNIFF